MEENITTWIYKSTQILKEKGVHQDNIRVSINYFIYKSLVEPELQKMYERKGLDNSLPLTMYGITTNIYHPYSEVLVFDYTKSHSIESEYLFKLIVN